MRISVLIEDRYDQEVAVGPSCKLYLGTPRPICLEDKARTARLEFLETSGERP